MKISRVYFVTFVLCSLNFYHGLHGTVTNRSTFLTFCDCSKIRFSEVNEEERSIILKIVANHLSLAGYKYLQ